MHSSDPSTDIDLTTQCSSRMRGDVTQQGVACPSRVYIRNPVERIKHQENRNLVQFSVGDSQGKFVVEELEIGL
jgi:hypothetical protein